MEAYRRLGARPTALVMVSINTFQWQSIRTLIVHPKSSSFVMLATVVVVVTHDLAKGVLVGVILSGIFFAQKVSCFFAVTSEFDAEGVRTYRVTSQLFFARAEAFHSAFDFRDEGLKAVVIDVHAAHFWDLSGINALDRVVLKFGRHDLPVEIVDINETS